MAENADLEAKLKALEARIAGKRARLEAMTEQERMEIGDFLESVSERFGDEDAAPNDPARARSHGPGAGDV